MKHILHVNTIPSGGGAAAVMQMLCTLTRQRGSHASILTGRPAQGEDSFLQPCGSKALSAWCQWRGLPGYDLQSSHRLPDSPLFQHADILHLHNLHGGYFNLWSLPALSARKPTVWTLHDMWGITGHCGYSLECTRYLPERACASCPSLASYPHLWRDTAHRLWQDKQRIYAASSLLLVTPSQWLQGLVEKSLLRDFPLRCIPNAVDTAVYRLRDKAQARQILGLPQNALLVGGCADGGLANPWKGGKFVLHAVQELKKRFPQLVFLNIGVTAPPDNIPASDWIRHIPYVRDPARMASLYAALDLLLYPTLADNHPLVCMESLCCGTPIAGFATGGVPEVVRHGTDGLLCPTQDTAGLIRHAAALLEDESLRKRMGQDAAASAARRFSPRLFIERYEKVYEEALRLPRIKHSLSLAQVPALVKTPAFLKLQQPAPGRSLAVRSFLINAGYRTAAWLLGWPLYVARRVHFWYVNRRQRT